MTTILHAVKGGLISYCDKAYSRGNISQKHGIGGEMVSVLASSAVDRGFEPRSGQIKDYQLVFFASLLSTQHYGERGNIGWLGIRIMSPNGVTFPPADCCFSKLACWSRTKRPSSSSH